MMEREWSKTENKRADAVAHGIRVLGVLFFLAMAFGLMRANYALFFGVACFILAPLAKKWLSTLFVFLLIFGGVSPQVMGQHSGGAGVAEMHKFDFLLGEWQGEGVISFGPERRATSKVRETVQCKAGGQVILIEGLGKAKLPGQEDEVPVHEAFAIAWYDQQTKKYRMQAFRAGSETIDASINVDDKTLVWGFPDERAGNIRFTIKLDDAGRWKEIGESSRDGQRWQQFFEMSLQRKN